MLNARFMFLTFEASCYDKARKHYYELNIVIIDKINKVLKDKHSIYYEALTELKQFFSENPKQKFHRRKY
jgi:nitrate reductase assembly molybdenum cofactor insertion protein NarJ